jgi:sialate O-acetylesterase
MVMLIRSILAAATLATAAATTPSVVVGGRPPTPWVPCNASAGICFSRSLGSSMVLQQAPAKACVYGMLGAGGTGATVKISSNISSTIAFAVDAEVRDGGLAGGGHWKACLAPQKSGGDFTITATCTGCPSTAIATIEHVTFGDVWYCAGQSNMALPLLHTYSRNETRDAILAGKYANIRIHGLAGNMNAQQPWATLKQALRQRSCKDGTSRSCKTGTDSDSSSLMSFSAACFYFAQELSDTMGAIAPPLGLVHTAWGGSTIEQWLTNESIATCQFAGQSSSNQQFHDTRVAPYLGMSLKGFLWYQGGCGIRPFVPVPPPACSASLSSAAGENDCHGTMGNSVAQVGYSCQMQALVGQWRKLWHAGSGTERLAPFGIVTLASSGSEGASSLAMGAMRQAQTAGFGVLPPRAAAASSAPQAQAMMANTFLAQAYRLCKHTVSRPETLGRLRVPTCLCV